MVVWLITGVNEPVAESDSVVEADRDSVVVIDLVDEQVAVNDVCDGEGDLEEEGGLTLCVRERETEVKVLDREMLQLRVMLVDAVPAALPLVLMVAERVRVVGDAVPPEHVHDHVLLRVLVQLCDGCEAVYVSVQLRLLL